MSVPGEEGLEQKFEEAHCLARSVARALADDPTLEAVTIDRERKTISVATIGRTDAPKLAERISSTLQKAQEKQDEHGCTLLAGAGQCRTCLKPLPEAEQRRITIQHEGNKTTIARVTCPTAPKFWRWNDIPWPKVVQRDVEFLEHAEEIEDWRPQLVAAILCGGFGLAAYFLESTPRVSYAGFALAYVAGGWYTVQEVWERLQKRAIDVHFLMLAVAAGSACIGALGEGATLLFLFSLSGALEHYALGRTQREIRSLFHEAPKSATVVDEDGHERELPVEKLMPGMRLLIKPGAQFPVDGEIVRGQTASDESNLTGESTPVDKRLGDSVLSGTMNLWGAVEVQVLRPVAESSLGKIIRLIKDAQRQKAPAQRFTDTFGTVYTYGVLGLTLAMFFVWWLAMGQAPFAPKGQAHSAFYHAMTLLVVASPCALVLSIPSAVLAAIAWGARHGILFRGGAAVEKLAGITTVALDKTGTLTTGELKVERVESFPPGRETEVAQLAYSLEKLSTHPLARAITRYGKQHQFASIEFDDFESVTGQGLRGRRNGCDCFLGKREWLGPALAGQSFSEDSIPHSGLSEIWLAHGELNGRLILRDDIRPQARGVIEELREAGLQTVVLTGDHKASAHALLAQLKVDDVRAELKPEAKLAEIRSMTEQGKLVAMVGDGVNDAPSLAAAHIGVAMGARGSDAALEQADVVLMHDRLENFLAAFRLSKRARRVIRQNLVISLGTVVVLVTFAMMGKIPLTIGVVGHEGSTVIVVMNSLRLLLGRQRAA
ncbi:MAG TPA: heavy metal translocating P-type ATPase [Verrucomicrobiae bacterium]|nr:heavy metal translocating P-type ATPase [Verrucomicrobiae bacterium]